MLDFNQVVRGGAANVMASGALRPLEMSPQGDLMVSQNLPERAMLVAQANSWWAMPLVAQASTFLVAQPTTAFATSIYNGDSLKSYVIDRVSLFGVTSMAAAQPASFLAAIIPPSTPIPTTTGTVVLPANIGNLGGKGPYTGNAVVKGAGAMTALPAITAGQWFPLGQGLIAAPTTNLGLALEALCFGRYVIRPGASFLVNAIAGTAAGTFVIGVEWHEVTLPVL